MPAETQKIPISVGVNPFHWKSVIRPLWLVSLGLHLLVLRIPIQEIQPQPVAKKSVKITKLAPKPTATEPSPQATVKATPRPTAKAIVANPKSKPNKLAIPAPTPTPKSAPTPTPTPTPKSPPTPTPTLTPTPTSTPTPTQTTTTDLSDQIEDPIGDVLGDLKGLSQDQLEAKDMPNPELFKRPSAIKFTFLEEVQPEDAWDKHLKTLFRESGFDISESPKGYGGGKVYILRKPSYVRYLNLVPGQDGQGTVVVVWKTLPTS